MEDHKVAVDEARRDAQQASIKSQVAHDVNADIAQRAEYPTKTESQRLDKVAGNLRGKAIDQVVSRDRAVGRARGLARFSQVVDYVFYVIYTLLLVRLVLVAVQLQHRLRATDPHHHGSLLRDVSRDRGEPDSGRRWHAGAADHYRDRGVHRAPRDYQGAAPPDGEPEDPDLARLTAGRLARSVPHDTFWPRRRLPRRCLRRRLGTTTVRSRTRPRRRARQGGCPASS